MSIRVVSSRWVGALASRPSRSYLLCAVDGDPMEAVLDFIVERKRADDLASSIVDGRFQEQKVFTFVLIMILCTRGEVMLH